MADTLKRAMLKMSGSFRRRMEVLFSRGKLHATDATGGAQKLQIELQPGEVLSNVEHLEPYGFTSRPLPGAEVASASLGGDRNRTLVLIAADRRYRLKSLASGEVTIYDDQGQKVHLKRDGVHIQTALKVTVEAGGTVEIKGATAAPVKGIVQGDCLCAYTGAVHPMISATVKGSL